MSAHAWPFAPWAPAADRSRPIGDHGPSLRAYRWPWPGVPARRSPAA